MSLPPTILKKLSLTLRISYARMIGTRRTVVDARRSEAARAGRSPGFARRHYEVDVPA